MFKFAASPSRLWSGARGGIVRGIATAMSTAGLVVTASTVSAQSTSPSFYDLDDDPDALMLFGLDSIDGLGTDRTFNVINVYRGKEKVGNEFTWHINCPRKTLNIIRGDVTPVSSSTWT